MISSVIYIVLLSFASWGAWFVLLLEAIDGTGFFLTMFFIFRLMQVFLAPVVGGAGSDRARRSRDKED